MERYEWGLGGYLLTHDEKQFVYITVKVLEWDKFNPERSSKRRPFFKCDASMVDGPNFVGWHAEEFKSWIYILSMCARQKSAEVRINLVHVRRNSAIRTRYFVNALKKLESFQAIELKTCTEVVQSSVVIGSKTAPKVAKLPAKSRHPRTPKIDSRPTWEAYRAAYMNRYREEPIRNATVNAQLSQFVKRIPLDEAPLVAEFYLSHNAAFYVQQLHPVGLLLKDAEALRTQWARGRAITGTDARAVERIQNNANAFSVFASLDKGVPNGKF